MAVNSVLPPYQIFPDADGTPLEGGYIYIGQPGFEARSNPKASFFDIAQTIPTGTASGAAIRTSGGFPVRNGAPAMFYVDDDFSISVTDRNGALLYSALSKTLALNVGGTIGPLLAPDGNLAAVGIGFLAESNTGLIRNAPGSVQDVVTGAVVSTRTAAGTAFTQPVSGPGFVSGVNAVLPTAASLEGLSLVAGDILYATAADTLARLALGASGRYPVSNGTSLVYSATEAAPLPQVASGVGEWVQIFNGASVANVLPAGGTWAYFCIAFAVPGGTLVAGGGGGIAAGGTTVLAANASRQGTTIAWRIT